MEHDNNNDVLPGESLYQHPPLTHCVLPPAGGDHSSNISGGSSPRQVCPLHHDPGHLQVGPSETTQKNCLSNNLSPQARYLFMKQAATSHNRIMNT